MNILRIDPFRDAAPIQEMMNRFFDEGFSSAAGERGRKKPRQGRWVPVVDIYEADGTIVLKAELPEVSPDDVTVSIEQGILTINGERKQEKDVEKNNYHFMEIVYGTFSRSFSIPDNVESDAVKANFKNGVLTITLPKKPEEKPRSIKINVNSKK